jgi:Na+/melibiose symporter-like transporter
MPQILINSVKYKGSWYSKYILDAICTGFTEDQTICHKAKSVDQDSSGVGFGFIILVTLVSCFSMIVLLYCYKRVVNRSLEQSLNEKIQQQAIHTLGQYQVFKDDTGRKSVDVTNL